jgi:hypothetical protein
MDWRNTYCEREMTDEQKTILQDLIDDVEDYAASREFKPRETEWRRELLSKARALLAASAPNTRAEPVAKYLVIAMDDDQRGHPVFCADENALHSAVRDCMFMEGVELDPEENEQVAGTVSALIEDGHVSFEGDPGIHLYHLPEGYAAPLATPSDKQEAVVDDDDARNRVTLDRRDLWDHVRGAIHAALNDKIPKNCVVSWAWEEATNRTMDIFQKIVDTAPLAQSAEQDRIDAEQVATITGADEHGPLIEWHKHWVDLIGAALYIKRASK